MNNKEEISVVPVGRVVQLRKNITRLVGRNSPCPCGKKKPNGSPIKFKKCCWLLYQSGELKND